MKKLLYNPYSNISEEDYIDFKKRLSKLENNMSNILLPIGWHTTIPVRESEGLTIDFTKRELNHYENIGLAFSDYIKGIVFSFYVTKSVDVANIRYFLIDHIFKNQPFEFFENRIISILKDALNKYKEWTDEKVIELGEQVE